jgi:hypothetical protein
MLTQCQTVCKILVIKQHSSMKILMKIKKGARVRWQPREEKVEIKN